MAPSPPNLPQPTDLKVDRAYSWVTTLGVERSMGVYCGRDAQDFWVFSPYTPPADRHLHGEENWEAQQRVGAASHTAWNPALIVNIAPHEVG